MSCRPFLLPLALAALCCLPLPTRAQVASDPLRDLQNEADRQSRDQRLREPVAPSALNEPAALNARPQDLVETGPATVMQIQVIAHDLLDDATVAAVTAPYRDLPLGAKRLDLLQRQLKAQLVLQGLVTSTVDVTRLDAAGGALELTLQAGRVAALKAMDDDLQAAVAQAFPLQAGHTLVLQDIEQGVQQVNRLRLHQAEVRIVPTANAASHVVEVDVQRSGRAWGAASIDNRGSDDTFGTGKIRLRGSVNLENPFGRFDSLGLTWLHTRRSNALMAAYSLPDGYNTWSLSAAASRYHQPIPGGFTQRGEGYTLGLGYNRTLLLTASDKNSLDIGLTRSHNGRSFEGVDLASQRLSVLRSAFLNVHKAPGRQTYVEVAVAAGLPWLGAQQDDPGLLRTDAHAQFTKLELHAGWDQRLASSRWRYSAQLDWQSARESLYGAEQFILGGLDTVRGFREGVVAGDRGWLLRQELHAPPQSLQALTLAPYLFLDHGQTTALGTPTARLSGIGLGLRTALAGGQLSSSLGKPLKKPATVSDEDWYWHLSLSYEW